jgi:aspartate carbamoyltransferase
MDEFASFNAQLNRPIEAKNVEFQRMGRLKHIINAAQLTPDLLQTLCRTADSIRRLAKTRHGNVALKSLLADKRAMLYFTQPSTRTFLSFMAACQILGLTCNEVRDPKTSSEVKRESRTDSIRMFSSYFDIIIMRSQIKDFAECCAYLMNRLEEQEKRSVPVINAGSGSDEHPTQALLDYYTIDRSFDFDEHSHGFESRLPALRATYPDLVPGVAHKTYAFCGDIGRGRTVRSLARVLAQFPGVSLFFVSADHPDLMLDDQLRQKLKRAGANVQEFHSLEADVNGRPLIEQIDCLYMTRIQREHNSESTEEELKQLDLSPFRLTLDRVHRMKEYAPILHPFPRDSVIDEIPIEVDNDPRAMYFRQARNGMWIRAALLVHLFDAADRLHEADSLAR